jgi:hypothetical protein
VNFLGPVVGGVNFWVQVWGKLSGSRSGVNFPGQWFEVNFLGPGVRVNFLVQELGKLSGSSSGVNFLGPEVG